MKQHSPANSVVFAASSSSSPASEISGGTQTSARLKHVAAFDHQVTGVTLSADGRIFVNFPRWTEDCAISMAELIQADDNDEIRPYPDVEWNEWRNAKRDEITPADHWACGERAGEKGPADGLLFDRQGLLYVSSVQDHAIKVRDSDTLRTLISDPNLSWPDTFAEGPDGTVYVTDSRIPDMNWFKPDNPTALPTRLLMITR